MNNFIADIKKLLANLLAIKDNNIQYSEKSIDSGIKTSRTIKCCKETKEYSYYLSKFKGSDLDQRDFVRFLIEIPSKNNLKSQNIDIVMNYIQMFENYFIYNDIVKVIPSDGIIYLDIYRENKFPKKFFTKKGK